MNFYRVEISLLFMNRIAWAKTYLKKTGFIESPKRGYYKITERGLTELKKNPKKIDSKYLSQFTEFDDFLKTRVIKRGPVDKNSGVDSILKLLTKLLNTTIGKFVMRWQMIFWIMLKNAAHTFSKNWWWNFC